MLKIAEKVNIRDFFEISFDLPKNSLILDIETCGLFAKNQPIFLVGLLMAPAEKGGDYEIIQIMTESDSPEEEKAMLEEVLKISGSKILISFNGKAFDLPFINTRLEKYGLMGFNPTQIDIYYEMRSMRRLLGFKGLGLKNIEKLATYDRKDRLSSKEVADSAPLRFQNEVRDLLLLHNHDDLIGSLGVYNYFQTFKHSLSIMIESGPLRSHMARLSRFSHNSFQGLADFILYPASNIKGFHESSYGKIEWEDNKLHLSFPLHGGYLNGEKLRVGASPLAFPDSSPYNLKAPIFTVSDKDRDYGENIVNLLSCLIVSLSDDI